MREKFIAGNWKMYTTVEEGVALAKELKSILDTENLEGKKVVIIPPFLHIPSIVCALGGSDKIAVGAQNCHYEKEGAYTGEISPKMLKAAAVTYVVLGHSERRQYFNETNSLLNKKVNAVLAEGLTPIYCCGETLAEREGGFHLEVVQKQIEEGVLSLSADEIKNIVVAYEPVWAIGTGVTASPEQAQEIHAHIRSIFTAKYGEDVAQNLIILYGGSVKPNNAKELFGQQDIDGGLVGGAALKAADFAGIITADKVLA